MKVSKKFICVLAGIIYSIMSGFGFFNPPIEVTSGFFMLMSVYIGGNVVQKKITKE